MKRLYLFLLPALFVLAAPGCDKDENRSIPEPKQLELPDKAGLVIEQCNSFGFELFREIAQEEPENNLMISPLSASVALTMLLNGCQGNTYEQIHDMLGYGDLSAEEINGTYQSLTAQLLTVDPDVELALANAVWYREGFQVKASFLSTMQDVFESRVEGLDFSQPSSLDAINGWASDNTNGKIKKVLDKISPDAVMFLMNALYFKGTWTWKFDQENTSSKPFTNDYGNIANVETMSDKIPSRVYMGDGYRAIEIYYGRMNFSMIIILPSSSIQELLSGFSSTSWDELTDALDQMQSDPEETDLQMPKFTFDYEKQLNDRLKSLGMTDAFEPSLADLGGISDAYIYVNFVKQNTFVNVDEEGTEAAAVTTIGIYETSIQEPFIINKSFIFAIRERTTNTLMFIGKVMEP
jgi:serpin B